jgi:hypothetical protein
MADTKISALPASTVPLAGTEVLPIVQSSSTKQVSVANLTAGRSFDALGMTLTSTDAGATAAPTVDLYRNSASPAAADTLGEVEFNGKDSAGNKQAYALFHGSILSPTSGAEQGQLHFETSTAGALTEKMIIGTTNLVVNEIGAIFNVRIEGDTDANLFYTDATNDKVGVGTVSPAVKFDVVGTAAASGGLLVGTTNTTGIANNSTETVGGLFKTINGNTGALATSASANCFTATAGYVYLVMSTVSYWGAVPSGNYAQFSGMSFVAYDVNGNGSVTKVSGPTQITFSFSGSTVQVTCNSNGPMTIAWSAIRLV